jgi:NAD(P)-dependent dehydrogenase (short-subunit alcohol dehydrogenase family)
MIELNQKHIFVAGGSRGLGAATATIAASIGARVSLTYHTHAEAAQALVNSLQERGGQAIAFPAEIQDEAQLTTAIASAVQEFGPLHGLVVSASIFEQSFIGDMTVEFWERTMSINLRGTFLAVKAATQHMRAAGGGGSIVIFTSTAGQGGNGTGYSAYATSKGAQIAFMRCMAQELAADRIRVNCVVPTWTPTDMTTSSIERIGLENLVKNVPLGRLGQPEDVAGATCYLLSDLAQFITGITLTVDGGMVMRG